MTNVEALMKIRNRSLDDYLDGRTNEETYRADMGAIAVELDRLVSPSSLVPLEQRAARVVDAILADTKARHSAVAPTKAARLEFWHGRYLERRRLEDPQGDEAALREEGAIAAAQPDDVRMARPILAALRDQGLTRAARERVRAIAQRPQPKADAPRPPAFPGVVWTDDDRLSWEELLGGVPCQGCGMAMWGNESGRRDGEPWPAFRERMEPIEAEFSSRHPDHGTRWTAGGGPLHCSRCCPPPPLSPEQVARLHRIISYQGSHPTKEIPVRHCGTCHKGMDGEHVCQLEDLPKKLRGIVEAILEQERGRQAETLHGRPSSIESLPAKASTQTQVADGTES